MQLLAHKHHVWNLACLDKNSLDVSKHASLDVQDRSSTQYISAELGSYWFYLWQLKPSPDKPEQRWTSRSVWHLQ